MRFFEFCKRHFQRLHIAAGHLILSLRFYLDFIILSFYLDLIFYLASLRVCSCCVTHLLIFVVILWIWRVFGSVSMSISLGGSHVYFLIGAPRLRFFQTWELSPPTPAPHLLLIYNMTLPYLSKLMITVQYGAFKDEGRFPSFV